MESQRKLEENVPDVEITKKKMTKKRSRKSPIMKKLSCFRSSDYGYPTVEEVDGDGNIDLESASTDKDHSPTHLVVMVNGLIGRLMVIDFGYFIIYHFRFH